MFLDQYLQGVFGLTKKESEDVRFLFEKRKIKKGGHIQTEGQVNRHLLILETGIIREYYLKDGKEDTKLITKCFIIVEQRLMQFLTLSAEQRYLEFFEQYKELFNEVSQQHIASMLGMSPETLSRFRAKHTISFS